MNSFAFVPREEEERKEKGKKYFMFQKHFLKRGSPSSPCPNLKKREREGEREREREGERLLIKFNVQCLTY